MRVFLLLALFVGTFAQNIPTDSCSLCTLLVDGLESKVGEKVSKADLMNQLDIIQSQVCTKIPAENQFLTPQQCVTYVRLYGPYVVELLLENTKTSAVCTTLGLCQDTTDGDQYDMILPTITDYMVEYDVKDTQVSSVGQQFRYKMFLGTPPFSGEDVLSVHIKKNVPKACSLKLELTNKSTEHPYTSATKDCYTTVMNPGSGVWYYLTIEALELNATCTFSVKSTIKQAIFVNPLPARSVVGIVLLPGIFMIAAVVAALCCCCAIRRRKCKSQCNMKTQQTDVKSVELAPMQQTQTPVGYFYVPATGQYVQVPQVPQQMAYPEYYVVQE